MRQNVGLDGGDGGYGDGPQNNTSRRFQKRARGKNVFASTAVCCSVKGKKVQCNACKDFSNGFTRCILWEDYHS